MLVFLLVFSYICIVIIAVITSKEIRGNTINRLDLAATKSGLFNFMEIWKDIDGFQGYQVSNLGNIKSIRFGKEKILKTSSSTGNYRKVKICVNKKYKFLGYFTNEIDAANAYQNALSAISIPS